MLGFPEPPPHCLRASLGGGKIFELALKNRGNPRRGFPRVATAHRADCFSPSCVSLTLLKEHARPRALFGCFALCGARPEAARLNERRVLSASTSVQYQTDTKCEQQQNQLSLLSQAEIRDYFSVSTSKRSLCPQVRTDRNNAYLFEKGLSENYIV